MPNSSPRVPTSGTTREGWSVETALDHVSGIANVRAEGDTHLLLEKIAHVITLILGNDKRYEQRFDASQKALELGLSNAREAVNTAFTAQEKAINAALAAADRAVLKAELATEKRFESVNEFRGTLDNQQRTLIPRSEVDVIAKGLTEKIAGLTKITDGLQATITGMAAAHAADLQTVAAERAGVKGGWGYAVGVLGFILTLVSLGLLIIRAVKG